MKLPIGPYIEARLERLSTRPRGAALVYHRVGEPPGDPLFELVPALSTHVFETQLRYLRRAYRVVPPSRLLEAALERRVADRFPIAITFDDDLRSHVEVVRPALARAGLPAAFFLCGASLGTAHRFWWEDLQALADQRNPVSRFRSLPHLDLGPVVRGVPNAIHKTAEAIERLPPAQRDAVAAELRMLAPRQGRRFSGSDVEALAAAGFEIGFHTRRHYLLTTLDDAALSTAMLEGRQELEALVGRPVTMMAYPHGKANVRVAAAARSAGYERAFTAYAIPVAPTTDAHMIGRVEVPPTASLREFARMIAATLAREATDSLAQSS